MLLADFKTILSNRLNDSSMVYWTNSELDSIINEALLNWAAISAYWKSQILIETTDNTNNPGNQIYNLINNTDLKTGYNNVSISLTYQIIANWINTDLIGYEDLLTDDELITLITNAVNEFQSETKLVLTKNQFNINVGQKVNISDDVLDIAIAYYIDSSGKYYSLELADENSISLFRNSYTINQARPRFYSINNLSLQSVDLFPRPAENGFLELVYVVGKSGIQTLNSDCLIPNNLVPYLKYKVLADIFGKDGESNDPARKAYCLQRWQEGLIIGKNYALATNIKLDGINKTATSFSDLNRVRYGWRNDIESTTKRINSIALAGYNIIGLNRMPINKHSILIEAISNAPIDDASIELRSDFIQILQDYCIHLASFKDGVANIQKTSFALEAFVKAAAEYNQYLQSRRISYKDLLQKSKYPLRQAKILEQENAA